MSIIEDVILKAQGFIAQVQRFVLCGQLLDHMDNAFCISAPYDKTKLKLRKPLLADEIDVRRVHPFSRSKTAYTYTHYLTNHPSLV